MPQYDAGPGDWSDRPWEDPERKPKPHARRRRVTLPPWALLAIVVGVVIILCVSLVLIIRAIQKGGDGEPPTPPPAATAEVTASATVSLITPSVTVTPTETVVLPAGTPGETPPITEIAPGALVVVTGTGGAGLNLRAQPTTDARVIGSAKEGTVLTVLEGPTDAAGHTWWKARAPNGTEGWAAARYLVLKPEE